VKPEMKKKMSERLDEELKGEGERKEVNLGKESQTIVE